MGASRLTSPGCGGAVRVAVLVSATAPAAACGAGAATAPAPAPAARTKAARSSIQPIETRVTLDEVD